MNSHTPLPQQKQQNHYLTLSDTFSRTLGDFKNHLSNTGNGKAAKCLLITSSRHGEGKTLTAISIAKSLAQGKNARVLLIDINLKSPCLHQIFNTGQQPGLADLLLAQASRQDCCVDTGITNLHLLPLGSTPQNSNWLFDDEALSSCFNTLAEHYDYLVADSCSLLDTTEISLLCPMFDAILLVLECGITKWQVAKNCADKISHARGNLIGTVLNRRKFYIPRFLYA